MLIRGTAILKINGEKLLQIQDDGQFIQYVVSLIQPIYATH